MTCIAILKNKRGKIYVAADRRVSDDRGVYQTRPNPKVIKRQGLILTGCGDSYLLDQISRHMNIPRNNNYDTDTYIHYCLYQAVQKFLINRGYTDDHRNLRIPDDMQTEILIVLDGRLYSMMLDRIIRLEELSCPYATGTGGELAWGSLLTTEGSNMTVEQRLKTAIVISSVVNLTCDNQVDIEHE